MNRESGVSNVVGVVLLLFLVMVTSAVLGLVLSSATYDAVDTTPDVIFTVSEDQFLLYHGGGDILYKNDLVFYAGGDDISDSISLENEGESWTDWHTGQAINTSNTGSNVSELTIVALDSRGNAYLVYNGLTADPIPGGKPVPDVTPVPTPSPVRPDASFTLTSVDVGQKVSPLLLPASLVNNTTDYFVVMKATEHWFILWRYYTYEAGVKFTANEDNLQYSWLVSSGADIDDDTSRSSTLTFNKSGLYTVTLNVTNTTSGLSNRSTQNISVRNPGLTAMTWVKYTSDSTVANKIFAYHRQNTQDYEWKLQTVQSWLQEGYRMTIWLEDGSYGGDDVYVNVYEGLPTKNTWYHVTGTYDQQEGKLKLFVKNTVTSGQSSVDTSSYPLHITGQTKWGGINNFICNKSYEIPFALTAAEIATVYDDENLDGHT